MAAEAMDDLADRYADRGVTSVFVYSREAHPAENYRHHTSMDVKRANARAFQQHSSVRRKILLDDLEGSAHITYAMLPNMAWIVVRGRIHYKAAWTHAPDIEDALDGILEAARQRETQQLMPLQTERLAWRLSDPEAFRAGLERNGPQAVWDFYGEE
jgi:predicted lipoprotein